MTNASSYRAAYLSALDLPMAPEKAASTRKAAKDEIDPHKDALTRAHDLRKFEIENYWKRATYFWAFQLVAFTLLGLIWKEVGKQDGLDRLALLVPAGLGAVSAQVGWLTAKGSKFWQENWEAHVDMLEREVEGRMTQVVLSKSGAQFSVSSANQNFMLLLMLGWVITFLIIVCPPDSEWLKGHENGFGLAALIASMCLLVGWSRTNLNGWRFKASQKEWQPYEGGSVKSWFEKTILDGIIRTAATEPEIVLRDTKAGRADKPEAKSK